MSNLTAIKYIGHRETYTDGVYGTRITFAKDQTRMVPADKAKLMLRHADVYVEGDAVKDVATVPAESTEESQDEKTQGVRDAIANMNKKALAHFIKVNYNMEADKAGTVADLRAKAIGLVDQYGGL